MTPDTATLIAGILNGTVDTRLVLERLRSAIDQLDPWELPAREPGLLLSALASTVPGILTPDIGTGLASVLQRGRLAETGQPGIDEVFTLLPLLVPTPAARVLPDIAGELLKGPDLHPRWRRRITGLLTQLWTWQPDTVSLEVAVSLAERFPDTERREFYLDVVEPLALAAIPDLTAESFQRACAVAPDPVESRYLANSVAGHPDIRPEVRSAACGITDTAFPLRAVWERVVGNRALRVLCVQNIADGQGDEIIRTVPLLQALLDANPQTVVTLITDRSYLYGHSRLTTLSFDDHAGRNAALGTPPDVLIDFFESNVRVLNYDPDLEVAIQELREISPPLLSIQSGKGMNAFTIDTFDVAGIPWAQALTLDRPRADSVYDPVYRLLAELGLPVQIGSTPRSTEPVLPSRPSSTTVESWQSIVAGNVAHRPIVLLNPFGGTRPEKGFTPRKFADLTGLVTRLIDEGYFIVIVPSGTRWGTDEAVRNIVENLPTSYQAHVAVAPDPLEHDTFVPLDEDDDRRVPYATAVMRQLIAFVSRADLIVAVEGWMIHVAHAFGKPFRVLMLSSSQGTGWLPWGRSNDQRTLLFAGDPEHDDPLLPEYPRKHAWLELIRRAGGDRSLVDVLSRGVASEDEDIRLAATRALGQSGSRVVVPLLAHLLNDQSHRVRGAAATMLLGYHHSACGTATIPNADVLHPYRLIGGSTPDWNATYAAGLAALPALRKALAGEDPVIRREAAIILELLDAAHESAATGGREQS